MSTAADTAEGAYLFVDSDDVAPIERRQHERLTIYLRVRWEGSLGCYEGTVSDISAGGCFILCDKQAMLKELVRLEIELHTGEWVKVWGEVTNQFAAVGFGVKYTEFEEEGGHKFTLSLQHTRSIKLSVEALKRVDGALVGGDDEGTQEGAPRVDRQQYKTLLALTLPVVNKTLLDLPECRKKTALRMAVKAYADVYRVWSAVSDGMAANPKSFAEAYRCLKDRYEAPPGILEATRRGELPPVLSFLRQKARIYFTFVS